MSASGSDARKMPKDPDLASLPKLGGLTMRTRAYLMQELGETSGAEDAVGPPELPGGQL